MQQGRQGHTVTAMLYEGCRKSLKQQLWLLVLFTFITPAISQPRIKHYTDQKEYSVV
jgi:hypothetical protein